MSKQTAKDAHDRFLYQKVRNYILKDIELGKYAVDELIPNEKQLCELYQVSLITIRRALDDLSGIGVITKIKGKGSVVASLPSPDRKSPVASAPLHKVGVLLVGINQGLYPTHLNYENNWSSKIIYGMKRALGHNDLYIIGLPYDHILDRLPFLPINGMERIVLLGGWDIPLVRQLEDQGKRIFLFNNFEPELHLPSVNNNERSACYAATSHMIDQGHQKLAVINGFYNFSESKERYHGFQNALFDHGIDILPFLVKWGDYTADSGYYLMQEMLESAVRPTAVFCANDTIAAGALHALHEAGLNCPRDISLFGHDNLNIEYPDQVKLSTIEPHFDEVGYKLGEFLLSDELPKERLIVSCDVLFRESVSRI